MSPEVEIDLLKHQIHEMSQDIENYLERMERYEKALIEITNHSDKSFQGEIAKEALEV